jgi:hypothetical protein
LFSEEVFNSLHQRDQTIDKDRNNNSTNITTKAKSKVVDKSSQKIVAEMLSGVQTLKRKRDSKSPSAKEIVESPSSDATSRKQSTTTATILVSKTKTKTGLPLLLKK